MDWELLLENARIHVLPQSALLVLALAATLLAAIGRWRGWKSSKWLAAVGIAAPIAALGLLLIDLAFTYQQMLAIHGLVESVVTPPPPDQVGSAVAHHTTLVREVLGLALGLTLPFSAWVWGRVHWPERENRGLRWLAVVAAVVATITGWSVAAWSFEFIYTGFRNPADCPSFSDWEQADASFASLEQVRMRVLGGGVLVAAVAVVVGALQARRGRMLRMEGWVALLAFVGLACLAKLSTSDERRDTQAAFPSRPLGQDSWPVLKGYANDPHQGPRLDHCTFNTAQAMNLLDMNHQWGDPERWSEWGEWIDNCAVSEGIGPILAEPERALGDIVPALQSARAHGHSRFGVASLRPIAVERATTGEFLRLQTCVVEFAVADDGVPLERFASWGDFAAAADVAEGALVVAFPDDPERLPRSPEPAIDPSMVEAPSVWAPYLALPDR